MVSDYDNVCTVQYVLVCNRCLYGFCQPECQKNGHYHMGKLSIANLILLSNEFKNLCISLISPCFTKSKYRQHIVCILLLKICRLNL